MKIKLVHLIFIGIILLGLLFVLVMHFSVNKNIDKVAVIEDDVEIEEETTEENVSSGIPVDNKDNNVASIGMDKNEEYLYLISDSLENKKIYKFSDNYTPHFILRDNKVYVIYEYNYKTKYVDVLDIDNDTIEKFTLQDIENNKLGSQERVYFNEDTTIVYKDSLTGEIISENVSIFQEDTEIINYDTQEITIDSNKVYQNDINTRKGNLIYESSNADISEISLITPEILQISVRHLGNHGGGVGWAVDEWKYYDLKNNEILDVNIDGFKYLSSLDLNLDFYDACKNLETLVEDDNENETESDEENTNGKYDISRIETKSSKSEKKILNDYNENVNENEVINKLGVSKDTFKEFKKIFIKGYGTYSWDDTIAKKCEYSKLSKRNFIVLENFILMSDTNITELIYKNFHSNSNSEYDMIYSSVFSGIIKYYMPDVKEKIKVIYKNSHDDGTVIDMILDSKYLCYFSFGSIEDLNTGALIYKGENISIDDMYDVNDTGAYDMYLNVMIDGYDDLGYWDTVMNEFN